MIPRFAALPLLAIFVSCSTPPPAPPKVVAPAEAPAPANPVPSIAAAPAPVERLDMDLVRRVDAAIQGRFGTFTEKDIKTRRFGIKRMGPPEIAHPLRYRPEADSEREMLAALSNAGWKGAIYAVGDGDQEPARWLKGPMLLGPGSWGRTLDRSAVTKLALKSREGRCAVQGEQGDVVLEARPVLASQKLCLRCHPGVKDVGDPVGAVVYAFVKDYPSVPTSGR